MKVISICNQKGGVGKTTTALTLATALREKGKSVILVDLDAQRNISITRGNTASITMSQVLTEGADIRDAISEGVAGDFISGDSRLSEISTLSIDTLRDSLKPLQRKYDIAIIDTPPNLGVMTINALVASNYCIIPAIADSYSLYGVLDLGDTIEAVREEHNRKLRIMGLLLTQHDARLRISKQLQADIDEITTELRTTAFNTYIRYSTKTRGAQSEPEGLFKTAKRAPILQDYRDLAEEVIQRL